MTRTIDARTIPRDNILDTDLCIVGAGTAGITLAHHLRGRNFRVCLVESGGLKPDLETQDLHRGNNIGHPYFELHSARARHFGGTTNRWFIPCEGQAVGVRMRPLDAIDFEVREWVPHSGWPFPKQDIDTYYEQAQQFCRIDPASYQVADWSTPGTSPPFKFKSPDVKSVIFKIGSRMPFVDTYYDEVRQGDNITTLLHANVSEILTDEAARTVLKLRIKCLNGNTMSITAHQFVLAAGALEIPRIMLMSNTQQAAGLGNQNDLVGRFFMEHLHFRTGVFVPSRPEIFQAASLYHPIHLVNNVPILGKLALSGECLRREKLLNFVTELMPVIDLKSALYRYQLAPIESKGVQAFKELRSFLKGNTSRVDIRENLRRIVSDVKPVYQSAYRNLKRKTLIALNKQRKMIFKLINMSEQAPNPNSRVVLGTKRDALAQNRIQLNWKMSPQDMQSADTSLEILDRELQAAGLGRLYYEDANQIAPLRIKGGWHHMGTTRMHTDPLKGVVDEHSRVHGISNLFIAGPSVFPTSGYANPSLTIVALTIRLADRLTKIMEHHDA